MINFILQFNINNCERTSCTYFKIEVNNKSNYKIQEQKRRYDDDDEDDDDAYVHMLNVFSWIFIVIETMSLYSDILF